MYWKYTVPGRERGGGGGRGCTSLNFGRKMGPNKTWKEGSKWSISYENNGPKRSKSYKIRRKTLILWKTGAKTAEHTYTGEQVSIPTQVNRWAYLHRWTGEHTYTGEQVSIPTQVNRWAYLHRWTGEHTYTGEQVSIPTQVNRWAYLHRWT